MKAANPGKARERNIDIVEIAIFLERNQPLKFTKYAHIFGVHA